VCGDDVLRAMTHALSEEVRGLRVGCTNMIDSRHVVHDCIHYADAVQRIPSISELCLVARVSERRLRKAFTDEYDMPPTKYFRLWALAEAHRRLLHNDAHAETVTEVALGFGFNHLGRFSVQYKAIYGEKPSTTLSTDSRRLSLV
jgi:AraC-like DNA-binding protein